MLFVVNIIDMKTSLQQKRGFSLIELLVVIAVVGILTGIAYASFSNARASARDDIRKSDLKQLQLAVEMYKAQNGSYPSAGTGGQCDGTFTGPGCYPYIVGLTPDFIPVLPRDPNGNSYQYRVNTSRNSYKIMVAGVEVKFITSYDDEFASCPQSFDSGRCPTSPHSNRYAVYGGPNSANW